MRGRTPDLSGRVFKQLTVVSRHGPCTRTRQTLWLCRCVCGNTCLRKTYKLTHGETSSCGCKTRENLSRAHIKYGEPVHGRLAKTYRAWVAMRERCENQKSVSYKTYGGRGVRVCERWRSFNLFLDDMGRAPDGFSLDRINNDGNYEPTNCRWASYTTQNNNRGRYNRLITARGQTLTISQWSRESGIHVATITSRLDNGWASDRAVTVAPRNRRSRSQPHDR